RLIAQCRARLTSALGAPARKIEKSYAPLRQAFRDGADTRRFRPGVDPDTALELLLLVAEGIEGQALDRLRVSAGDLQQESQAGAAAVASDLDRAGAVDLDGAGASDLRGAG